MRRGEVWWADFNEQRAVLPSAKLSEIEDALRLGGLK
jgi:hypothetical protein